ncbi:polyketide cyclase [Streptomyces sp. NBC_00335]|uniref:polyketide cyclase n=1 Tax=unclassified Streptomyces TaxID=2593676 RepID=UPI002250AFCE|nr:MULTISPECIES: polyketide cyclase [unclassified Streptomyces]MCX5407339.1 polyketide cyclase [Streptomyces sp. NBC_00086]
MWEYEHGIETTAAPEAIWALWADVENWGAWNADIEKIELRGPFAAGAEITMTPAGQDPVELLVAEVAEGEMFIDEARFAGLVLRTTHRVYRLDPALDPARSRVVYRMEISGEGAAEAGPEIGPAITADWPDTMAALVRTAQG